MFRPPWVLVAPFSLLFRLRVVHAKLFRDECCHIRPTLCVIRTFTWRMEAQENHESTEHACELCPTSRVTEPWLKFQSIGERLYQSYFWRKIIRFDTQLDLKMEKKRRYILCLSIHQTDLMDEHFLTLRRRRSLCYQSFGFR
ncbi:hypothetical protein BD289DRAFT_424718 [Coniella lustricola]|uniref:Secreted protein n=1 Tax=Coniella lustricola TaxID=2025994 RepID=A0A2T3AI78_9PEZI|nr:hypothetical protein BD289DRAFT_424718 [Coniella lustricola]